MTCRFLSLLVIALSAATSARAATDLSFTVNTSETVTVNTAGGTPRLQLDVGGQTRYAAYASGSGTAALTFTYTSQAGDLDLNGIGLVSPLQMNGGTIIDAAGNALSPLTFTLPSTTGVLVDYPSISMNFIQDGDGDFSFNNTRYTTLSAFLSASGGTFSRASMAYYTNVSGTLSSAPANQPRFDYDPVSLTLKGLLIERSATNTHYQSETFDNAAWTKTNTTITANATTAPDGTNTADKLVENSATAVHYVHQNRSGNDAVRTFSIYAKAAERTSIQLEVYGDVGSSGFRAYYDLSAGTVLSTQVIGTPAGTGSATITAAGNGWYRCQITGTPSTTGNTVSGALVALRNAGASSYLGNGTSGVYLWGAQVESSSFASSYIPTTGAAATRNTDVFSVPPGSWLSATAGTLHVEATNGYDRSTVGLAALDNSAAAGADRISIIRVPTGNIERVVSASNVFSYTQSVAGNGDLQTNKTNITFASNDAHSSLNGVLGAPDSSVIVPPLDRLRVGAWGTSTPSLGGWIRVLKYYPARVETAQLPLLSQ